MVSALSREEVERFLAAHHRAPVEGLERLRGGFWSAAYGYRVGGEDLVARFGAMREGYEMDRAAMAFARPGLPVPEVRAIGDAFGGPYAISVRHPGRFLEDLDRPEADRAAPAVGRLLAARRSAGAGAAAPSAWFPASADGAAPAGSTWRGWLMSGLVDDPRSRVSGWRTTLAEDPAIDRLFEACSARIGDLVEACPERRDLVHGDLLHQNVLLAHDLSEVTAVFSWKCSVLGDFLFDVACCTFWGPWHPGIAALDLWRAGQSATDLSSVDLGDVAARHHCYELQIGASHLAWNAWTGDHQELRAVSAHLTEILERGPRTEPTA